MESLSQDSPISTILYIPIGMKYSCEDLLAKQGAT